MLEEGRNLTQSEVETYFDGGSICKAYNAVRPRKRTNLQVCFLLSLRPFRNVTQGITKEIASCPAAANSIVWEGMRVGQRSLVRLLSIRTFIFFTKRPLRTHI